MWKNAPKWWYSSGCFAPLIPVMYTLAIRLVSGAISSSALLDFLSTNRHRASGIKKLIKCYETWIQFNLFQKQYLLPEKFMPEITNIIPKMDEKRAKKVYGERIRTVVRISVFHSLCAFFSSFLFFCRPFSHSIWCVDTGSPLAMDSVFAKCYRLKATSKKVNTRTEWKEKKSKK